MERTFLTRTENDCCDAVVDAIASREQELMCYDDNCAAYESQLSALDAELPAEWPSSIAKYKGKAPEQVYAIGGPEVDMVLAVRLNHRERIRMLHFTEQAERRKSELAYAHICFQLTEDPVKRQAALDRYAARKAAGK